MKKRILACTLIASMVLGLAACGSGGNDSAANNSASAENTEQKDDGTVYKMEISCTNADETVQGQILINFENLVEEKSEGRIQVERYMNATVCATADEPSAVSAGTITAAYCSGPAASSAGITLEDLYTIPFLMSCDPGDTKLMSAVEKDETIRELVQQQVDESSLNVYRLGDLATSLGCFPVANNKHAVLSVTDAQGLKIRTPGGVYYAMLIDALGASAQSISASEVAVALQQGVVDGVCTNLTYYNDSMLHTKYLTMPYVFSNTMPFYINKDWWDALPADLQTVVKECYEASVDYAMDILSTQELEALDEIQNTYGVQVDYLDFESEEGQKFRDDLMQKGIDQFVSDNGEVGQQIVDRVLEIREELGM